MNNEKERMWKEAVMAQFQVLSQHLLEASTAHGNQSLGQNLYPKPLKYEAGVPITWSQHAALELNSCSCVVKV
jgi:hypothetical protein